ncbi:MAG: L,D-transpeptidase, partial [Cyanobacteria bacterium]|nr:L,D-transpeptidase [Cyanobacteriota bacterium]
MALPLATLPLVTAPLWAAPGPASQPAPQPSSREIVLQLGRRTISLRDNGKLISSWPVAIGSPGTPTPLGRFVV